MRRVSNLHCIQRGTGSGDCWSSQSGAELGWAGEGEVDVEIEVKGQPAGTPNLEGLSQGL